MQLLAEPWWVNLLVLIPVFAFLRWRRSGLDLRWTQLLAAALFAASFGFVEAAVVVYLRAAVGLLPAYQGSLADVQRAAADLYRQEQSISQFPQSLLTVEIFREAATMIMLLAVAILSATRARERWAMFLWTFALWDISYYAGLFLTVRWPPSLLTVDVLFLIPTPWFAQVWFPVSVSLATLLVVVLAALPASSQS
jgi:hypothetical protein